MAEELEKWLANSNECFNLNLVRPSSKPDNPQRIFEEPFHPDFTYPIFGEDEAVFGYSDLNVNLDFRANDLKPSLNISYGEKWKPIGETKAMDVEAMVKEFLPSDTFESSVEKSSGPDAHSQSWKPPGSLLHSYSLHGKQFEIWRVHPTDPVAKELFRRIQLFVPFYIEGGTIQNLEDQDDNRWTLFPVYEVTPLKKGTASPYTLAGFATSYRLWIFPTLEILRATKSLPSPPSSNSEAETYTPPLLAQDPETHFYADDYDPLAAQSRERISQFVILPPYKSQGHGSTLYKTMFKLFLDTRNIFQITVEDPNEAFDDMRDYCDLAYLRTLPSFQKLSLPSSLPPEKMSKKADIPVDLIIAPEETITTLRHETKIIPRQLNRMIELHLYSTIPPLHRSTARITRREKSSHENDRKFYFWRLALKERLYRQNADQLAQIEAEDRVGKIEETASSVQVEYDRLLEGMGKRAKWAPGDASSSTPGASRRKRRLIADEEDDDEDGEEDLAVRTAAKRPKQGD